MRAILATIAALVPSFAHADEPTTTERYFLPIMAADVASIAMVAASIDNEVMIGVGIATYFAGGPIVHGVMGNGWGAAKSLGVRTGFVAGGLLIGGVLGAATDSECDQEGSDKCGLGALYGALVLGALAVPAAMIVDWTKFAKRTVKAERFTIAPTASSRNGTNVFGVVGTF